MPKIPGVTSEISYRKQILEAIGRTWNSKLSDMDW